ncbi:MAG: hypothetical protein QOK05_865 [Chloroflexota bacterium]|jgi:hypothetical protein|nr:hypothetical protein [Chloroflexota bacterium]
MGLSQARVRALVIVFQLAVVAGCGVLGWRLTHPGGASSVSVAPAAQAPGLGFVPTLAQPAIAPPPAAGPTRPGLADLVMRVNRDDLNLYTAQWSAIQSAAAATRLYLERHVLPLLLTAAKGGGR